MDRYFDVVALVSNGGPGSVAWSARHYPGIPHFDDLRRALALPSLDAVFLATPTPTHVALTCQALAAGCHVFVEKPLALRPDEARRAVSIAAERRLEVFVGYVYLFHSAFYFLRGAAPAVSIRSGHFDWVRPHLAGSLHGELLCHDLAVTIGLTGEVPERVVPLESDSRLLHCSIELPSGRSFESVIQLRGDVMKRKIVDIRYADGVAYIWRGDHVGTAEDPKTNVLGGEPQDAVAREITAFRSAVDGVGPRMVDDLRFSVGIGKLLRDVEWSTGA